jgi:hypothetical protein
VAASPAFAHRYRIPMLAAEPKQRKDDIVAEYRRRFTGRQGGRSSSAPERRDH